MNRAEKIMQKIKEKGLTNNQVERKAGVQSGTLRRWKKEDPKTFEMEDNINEAIEELSNEQQSSSQTA